MPKQKDLKRLVRARMQKTGESYTAARAQILKKTAGKPASRKNAPGTPASGKTAPGKPAPGKNAPGKPASGKAAPVPESDYARLAGMSDASVKAKTGRTWKGWVRFLDAAGAASMPHRDIARRMNEELDRDAWWAQTVTVGYERIKGLRKVGQRRDGFYEANKSKTFPVPVSVLYRSFRDARARRRWLPEGSLTVRTAKPGETIRALWDDGTPVTFAFIDKGKGKSAVSIQHGKLSSEAERERKKAFWGERLGAVAEVLTARR